MEYDLIKLVNTDANRFVVLEVRRKLGIGSGVNDTDTPMLQLDLPNGLFAISHYITRKLNIVPYPDMQEGAWKVRDEDYLKLRKDPIRLNAFFELMDEMNELCNTANMQWGQR